MSTTSTVDNSARPEVGKYSKRLCNLSKVESQLLLKYHAKQFDKTATRPQLLTSLFLVKPELKENVNTRLFCFEIYEDENTKERRIRYHNVEQSDEYPERRSKTQQIDIDAILKNLENTGDDHLGAKVEVDSLDGDQNTDHQNTAPKHDIKQAEKQNDENKSNDVFYTPYPRTRVQEPNLPRPQLDAQVEQDIFNSSLVSTLHSISNRLESNKRRPIVSKNLQYDADEDISCFFTKINAAAQGQGLSTDQDKISLATQVLSTSTIGSQLLGLCGPDDFKDWTRFSTKLLRMTGSSFKSYEQQFLSYKRLPGQPSSLLMAKLIDLYRRSCEYPENQQLNKFEERHIRMRFVLCLEPELRSLLEDRLSTIESDKLTLELVAERCQELETFYNLGSNAVKKVNAVAEETTSRQFNNNQFEALLNAIKEMRPNQRKYKGPNPTGDTLLEGFRIRNVKFGSCIHGDKCNYKHSTPPASVIKHMKNKYNVTPKSA